MNENPYVEKAEKIIAETAVADQTKKKQEKFERDATVNALWEKLNGLLADLPDIRQHIVSDGLVPLLPNEVCGVFYVIEMPGLARFRVSVFVNTDTLRWGQEGLKNWTDSATFPDRLVVQLRKAYLSQKKMDAEVEANQIRLALTAKPPKVGERDEALSMISRLRSLVDELDLDDSIDELTDPDQIWADYLAAVKEDGLVQFYITEFNKWLEKCRQVDESNIALLRVVQDKFKADYTVYEVFYADSLTVVSLSDNEDENGYLPVADGGQVSYVQLFNVHHIKQHNAAAPSRRGATSYLWVELEDVPKRPWVHHAPGQREEVIKACGALSWAAYPDEPLLPEGVPNNAIHFENGRYTLEELRGYLHREFQNKLGGS